MSIQWCHPQIETPVVRPISCPHDPFSMTPHCADSGWTFEGICALHEHSSRAETPERHNVEFTGNPLQEEVKGHVKGHGEGR